MYKDLIKYYERNEYTDPQNDPHGVLESIRKDEYNKQAVAEIYDALNDEEILHGLSTGVIKDMFIYYCKYGKDYYKDLPKEFK